VRIDAGAAIQEACDEQIDRDLPRLVVAAFAAMGQRIAAKLDAKAAEDPKWVEAAEYQHETLQALGVEP
jgi:hypothetical protein